MHEEDYRDGMDQIKAPDALVNGTIHKMRNERKRQRQMFFRTGMAACLAAVVLFGSYFIYQGGDRFEVAEVTELEVPGYSVGLHTGKPGTQTEQTDIFKAEVYQDSAFIPESMWDLKASRIAGRKIYICYDQTAEIYYAAAVVNGDYILITGEDTTEENFKEYLKNYF